MKTTSFEAVNLVFYLIHLIIAKHIEKRSVVFMSGSAIGYLVAVAVPVDLEGRNSFLAFNFEANYGLPNNQTHNDLIERFDLDRYQEGIENNVTSITSKHSRSFYSRKDFYKTITKYIRYFDLGGQDCLLRVICELASKPLSDHNGFLGTLFHVLFLPTFSKAENIHKEFYKAETLGVKRKCNKYKTLCSHNLLDLISTS